MLQIPELLAPAGDLERLRYAINYGADAVYCSLPEFPDHTLESVSRLVSAEQPVWTGSPSELADAVHAGMAANALSKYLNVKSGRLLDEYRVRYENKVRHEGRRITLTYDAESK